MRRPPWRPRPSGSGAGDAVDDRGGRPAEGAGAAAAARGPASGARARRPAVAGHGSLCGVAGRRGGVAGRARGGPRRPVRKARCSAAGGAGDTAVDGAPQGGEAGRARRPPLRRRAGGELAARRAGAVARPARHLGPPGGPGATGLAAARRDAGDLVCHRPVRIRSGGPRAAPCCRCGSRPACGACTIGCPGSSPGSGWRRCRWSCGSPAAAPSTAGRTCCRSPRRRSRCSPPIGTGG